MVKKTLSQFRRGQQVKIIGLDCGREFGRRLCDLGIFDGSEAMILKNDNFGPLIIKILNSKIALGRGEANKIYAAELTT